MTDLDPLARPFWDMVGSALLCGTIIGFERQLRGKPAGIRTGCLVTLGTATFISLAADQAAGSAADVNRVLGQLVTGVGFLGAGVMISQEGVVKGVTTGAVIWILAAIGSLIGLGHMKAAITISLITVSILVGIEKLESSVLWLARGVHAPDGNGRSASAERRAGVDRRAAATTGEGAIARDGARFQSTAGA
ncbi:MAG: MgtC/SapB family protein, partial [Beijerinckiaceae bacterium]|nr:MgtC/SapB family protein [Beijerinckiaceae bacterium]